MLSSQCILNVTVAAAIWAITCAAVPLTTPNASSIFHQVHDFGSLHISHNNITFAQNVQHEIDYINDTSSLLSFHGKAELFYFLVRAARSS